MIKKELIAIYLVSGNPTMLLVEYYLIILGVKFYWTSYMAVPDKLNQNKITEIANKLMNKN